ncbi:MAG: hypothetical protein O3B13_06745 [Planctomycetota bacterium]|nr:hypothetical protein [Planctomycetota bacterium]MDA1162781.1 hypothetical protein [Planctomycetota bacterium]
MKTTAWSIDQAVVFSRPVLVVKRTPGCTYLSKFEERRAFDVATPGNKTNAATR